MVQHVAWHTPGDGAAEDNHALRGVGMMRHERWEMLAKGLVERGSFEVEGEGQGRGVIASMFLSLRESLHGERGGLAAGSERERSGCSERERSGSERERSGSEGELGRAPRERARGKSRG